MTLFFILFNKVLKHTLLIFLKFFTFIHKFSFITFNLLYHIAQLKSKDQFNPLFMTFFTDRTQNLLELTTQITTDLMALIFFFSKAKK